MKCPNCKHEFKSLHVVWGGAKHHHKNPEVDCKKMHSYCMVTECKCVSHLGDNKASTSNTLLKI